MRILQNTLYVTSPEAYLSLDGETIVVRREDGDARVPLHNLESVIAFGYTGASPALMGACAQRGISLSFLTPGGRFLARVTGEERGNVVLRRTQYRLADSGADCVRVARQFITGKLYNSRWVLERAIRDHALCLDTDSLRAVSLSLADAAREAAECESPDRLRGLEGEAAARYFSVFDQLILRQKETFFFKSRSRRPPLDNVNALLSFVYTLLAHDTAAALETVGLDPYVGFLHRDRPGRASLALDLMEELRAVMADRFILTLINKQMIGPQGFCQREDGAVRMNDDTRRVILSAWQKKKQEGIRHPFLDEKMEWGLVPYTQALLLARYLRGDMDAYPPFLWK